VESGSTYFVIVRSGDLLLIAAIVELRERNFDCLVWCTCVLRIRWPFAILGIYKLYNMFDLRYWVENPLQVDQDILGQCCFMCLIYDVELIVNDFLAFF
jgi:hypothetical protein